MRRPVVLCILDGIGLGRGGEDDAVATAPTPTLDALRATAPWRTLEAHGTAVGLPSDDDMGNSEVGHNAMGAGRVFDQGSKLVGRALADGSAFTTPAWRDLVRCPTLHLLGLVSDGNVHSHVDHLLALLDRAARDGVRRLRVHALTDGRDVGARTAERHLHTVEARLEALRAAGVDARIASGGGRSVTTMDRYEADWRIVERGWRAHVLGEGTQVASAHEAVRRAYADPSIDDQTLPPFVVVGDDGAPVGRIEDGDGVLLFNFRGDRAIQICRAFEEPTLGAFDRVRVPRVTFAGLMQYDGDRQIPARFVVPPPRIDDTVSARLVAAGRSSFACSETQKFGHVTYFFNGNRSERLDPALETWVEIPSDVRPFDEVPWMKAAEITDACIAALRSGRHDHVRLNYANGDMVGHTGNLAATRVAVAAVDLCLGRLVAAVREVGGVMIVTADHGNADEMWQHDKKGAVLRGSDGRPLPKPSHTLAPVPLHLVDPTGAWRLAEVPHAGIASVGATILRLLDVPVPEGWAPPLVVPAAEPDSP